MSVLRPALYASTDRNPAIFTPSAYLVAIPSLAASTLLFGLEGVDSEQAFEADAASLSHVSFQLEALVGHV